MRLVELMKRNEGKTLEFKRDLSSPQGILQCLTIERYYVRRGDSGLVGPSRNTPCIKRRRQFCANEDRCPSAAPFSLVWQPRCCSDNSECHPTRCTLRNWAYVPPAPYTLRTETRLVEVGVVVRDSRGGAVGGLTRDDFEIEDGGFGSPDRITVDYGVQCMYRG
jgi:hypothetical protein